MYINHEDIDLGMAQLSEDGVSLVAHKKTRKHPAVGDFFGAEIVEVGWVLGRVVKFRPSDAPGNTESWFEDVYLVYVYKTIYDDIPSPPNESILPDLLIPPLIVSRVYWLKGLFVPIGARNIYPDELLDQHCFWDMTRREFHDDSGCILQEPSRPCADSAIVLLGGIELYLAKSLRDGFDQDNHSLK